MSRSKKKAETSRAPAAKKPAAKKKRAEETPHAAPTSPPAAEEPKAEPAAPPSASEPLAPEAAPKPTEAGARASSKPKRLSGLDAAHAVLKAAAAPMRAVDMLAEIQARGLWKTHGKTPEATLYAAIIREIARQGEASRFVKTGKGLFAAAT